MKHLRILILIPLTLLLTGSVTQQHLMVVARKNVAAGGDLADIKTGMLAWYDFDDGTDSHASYDLVATGTPDYSSNTGAITADSGTNYVVAPSGFIAALSPNTNTDATILVAFRAPTGTTSGAYALRQNTANEAYSIRYITSAAGPLVEVSNAPVGNAGTGGIALTAETDYVVGGPYDSATDTTTRYVNGVSNLSETGSYWVGTGEIKMAHDQGLIIYWAGFWTRKLTETEIAALTYDLTYADLP